ncbi:ABC transporter ATP-binding protein [Lentibacillus amyloliquefaciens]|uniref:Bacitracin ABC transporter ATP-binding protein n=1 Tax=Lentibacillus amyloliquefaciens TaxID=1472767 RepID=A0A0U4FKI7_9BACI|nr:ABC transporter ATP-binding protein [Lentibacillus amyloliquefaciens]ALX49166.1 bacitracin ABC transporter ATP-binding protein [Lentibacillus amyloliquefaciens]
MPKTAMELNDVKKTIGNKEVIKGLSFEIHKGEVFGFIGPNGAGKTTTIRMMVGLMGLSDGDVRILGESIKSAYKKAIREVGAIVENPEMYPFMTGKQNLKHYARMMPGVSHNRIEEVIKLVGLEQAINEKAGKYSLGMRQRLGIAQALLQKPSVLILDEPTNGLDPAGIREIRQYIRKLAEEEDVAVIISSHLLSEIEQMCDRIGLIKNGEMIAIQDVNAATEETSESDIQMEVTPTKHAVEVLKNEFNLHATTDNATLNIRAERETIPKIIQAFVTHDIQVYQVTMTKSTLEDKFFDLIGENTIE